MALHRSRREVFERSLPPAMKEFGESRKGLRCPDVAPRDLGKEAEDATRQGACIGSSSRSSFGYGERTHVPRRRRRRNSPGRRAAGQRAGAGVATVAAAASTASRRAGEEESLRASHGISVAVEGGKTQVMGAGVVSPGHGMSWRNS
jgi:hypothetical protein